MRGAINILGGLLLLGVVIYYVSNFVTADTRVRNLCSKVTVGMTTDNLNAYAGRVGLGPPARSSGTSFLVESKTFGRYGCRVEATDGVIRSAKYDVSN